MKKNIIAIKDIRNSLYEANLDTEYREALASVIMELGYVSDSPLNLYLGTKKQKAEMERVDTMPLDSNQISEIIHLMMYKLRDDFQYGEFKEVAKKYINISEKMNTQTIESQNGNDNIIKLKDDFKETKGCMFEMLCRASKILKENNMYNESREMIEKATMTYSYDEALNTIEEYVEIIENEEHEYEYEDEEDEI